jgi:hypothetical protein
MKPSRFLEGLESIFPLLALRPDPGLPGFCCLTREMMLAFPAIRSSMSFRGEGDPGGVERAVRR